MYDFSVLMSLYFKEEVSNLEECLNSLFIQTLLPNEVVIVFDGLLPESLVTVVESWEELLPIKIIKLEKNVGLGNALNIGLEYCQYDIVARMDTDDICDEYRFERQILLFNENKKLTICGSCIDEIEPSTGEFLSRRVVPLTHELILKEVVYRNPFNHMSVMYKKNAVLNVGSYQHLSGMEDWYLWLRLLSKGYLSMNIPESLVYARTGQDMLSRRSGLNYIKSEWELTRKKIDLGFISFPKAFFIFLFRSIPRLLPRKMLSKVYSYSRSH